MERDEHRDLEERIPGYLRGTLTPEEAGRFESHLETCAACTETTESMRPLVRGLVEGGPELLGGCPDVLELQSYALGESNDEDGAMAGHLESCLSCAQEVAVWRREGSTPGFGLAIESAAPSFTRSGLFRYAAAAAMAGLLFGSGLTVLLREGAGGRPWSGAVELQVLEAPLRSGAPATEVSLGRAPYAMLAVAPTVPVDLPDERPLRFGIERTGQSVWAIELVAGSVRSAIDSTGVVTLLVPATDLVAGEHRLTVSEGDQILLELPFRVVGGP